MSGWDMSSTPTWGPNDGPEESTQSFPVPGTGGRDPGQDFDAQDAGPSGYPRRTPGQSMRDLPRRESRGRHSAATASYSSDSNFGADNGFGQDRDRDPGLGQDYGQDSSFGKDAGFGQDAGFGVDNSFGLDSSFGQDSGFGQDRGAASAPGRTPDWGSAVPEPGDDGGWGRTAGRSVPPWEERPEQEFGLPDRQEPPRREPGRPGFGGQDDFPGRQDFPAQQEPGLPGRDSGPRMDPALQDFFAPQAGRETGRPDSGRPDVGRFESRPDQPASGPSRPGPSGPSGPVRPGGQPDLGQPEFGQPEFGQRRAAPNPYAELDPSRIGQPSSPRYRQTDGWGVADGRPAPSRSGNGGSNGTGPRPVPGGARHQQGGGLSGATVTIGLAVIVIAVVVVGGYLLLHHGGSNKPAASASTGTQTTHAAKPKKSPAATSKATSKTKGGGTAAAGAFVLSTPATAGGYPQGTDPHFLETATVTAKSIANAVSSGGAGTTKGSPVSAAYKLPTNGQVLTFVGYQGTFTPSKVATILASLGSDAATYPTGPNGGSFGCGNTQATASTPSGAVCVWATGSTLGVTEFFSSTGPEALTASQSKGAADALKLRGGVEAKKKS
jgi:hypothetical protein